MQGSLHHQSSNLSLSARRPISSNLLTRHRQADVCGSTEWLEWWIGIFQQHRKRLKKKKNVIWTLPRGSSRVHLDSPEFIIKNQMRAAYSHPNPKKLWYNDMMINFRPRIHKFNFATKPFRTPSLNFLCTLSRQSFQEASRNKFGHVGFHYLPQKNIFHAIG